MRFLVGCLTLLAACVRPVPLVPLAPVAAATPCSARDALVPGSSLRASTRLGVSALKASCLRGDAPECVYTLDVPTRSELRVGLESSDFDGALALYADGETPTELRCVDDVPSGDLHHARIDASIAPGRYLLVVDGASGEAGDFELFTELEPLPDSSAVCAQAPTLSEGAMLRESTRGGVHLFSATCGGGALGPEHVHKLELAQPSRVRIRQRADYDGSLYLRAVCEDPSSELVCNDDYQGNANSLVTARLDAGTYYVFSDSYSRDHSGDYTLALERNDEPASRSIVELCAEAERATPLASGWSEVDTFYGASALAGSCGGEGAPEVLIPLRVDAPTTLIAALEDAELNGVLYVRQRCADAESELACFVAPRIDRAASDRDSSPPALVAQLARGSYVLAVDGYEASDLGAATLRVLFAPGR